MPFARRTHLVKGRELIVALHLQAKTSETLNPTQSPEPQVARTIHGTWAAK